MELRIGDIVVWKSWKSRGNSETFSLSPAIATSFGIVVKCSIIYSIFWFYEEIAEWDLGKTTYEDGTNLIHLKEFKRLCRNSS